MAYDNSASNGHLYLKQWLKTASRQNVTAEFAWGVDRVLLTCNICDQSLATSHDAVSGETTIDYGVQEFVKIHAHTGGHKDPPQVMTDPSPMKAAEISAQTKKFLEAKLDDGALAKKIAMLQAIDGASKYAPSTNWSKGGAEEKKELEQAFQNKLVLEQLKKDKAAQQELMAKQFAAIAAQNELTPVGKNFADSTGADGVIVNGKKIYWKKDAKGNIVGVSDSPVAPVIAQKAPKQVTGRKFR